MCKYRVLVVLAKGFLKPTFDSMSTATAFMVVSLSNPPDPPPLDSVSSTDLSSCTVSLCALVMEALSCSPKTSGAAVNGKLCRASINHRPFREDSKAVGGLTGNVSNLPRDRKWRTRLVFLLCRKFLTDVLGPKGVADKRDAGAFSITGRGYEFS